MIEYCSKGVVIEKQESGSIVPRSAAGEHLRPCAGGFAGCPAGREKTMAYKILKAHNNSDGQIMRLRFDALVSHDITYVSIIQTARASGMTAFPVPYALTNCHNSLCAFGGTINEDDHVFGLSAAKKYGGIYVPANQAVIHQYAREELAACGKMILGSDSHTRYGCYGTLGVGEGGGELVKQLLRDTYDLMPPKSCSSGSRARPRTGQARMTSRSRLSKRRSRAERPLTRSWSLPGLESERCRWISARGSTS